MKVNEKLLGIFSIIMAIGIFLGTLNFRSIPGQEFGSAFFPRIISGSFLLLSILFLSSSDSSKFVVVPSWFHSGQVLKPVSLLAAGILWIFLSPYIGFIGTTFILLFSLMVIFGGQILIAVAVAASLTMLFHGIFSVLLRVPLPYGFVEQLIR